MDALGNRQKVLKELVDGIKLYFDRALGNMLLYRFERPQFEQYGTDNPGFEPSQHYGAEHLLRLLGTRLFRSELPYACAG